MVRLLSDVRLSLTPPENGSAAKKTGKTQAQDPIQVTGKSMDFGRDSRTMHLLGPVEAETRMARLLAGELTLTLDSSFRAEKLVATPGADRKKPQVEYQGTGGRADLSAETLTAHFAPGGWLTR